jgi:hypothetical protein
LVNCWSTQSRIAPRAQDALHLLDAPRLHLVQVDVEVGPHAALVLDVAVLVELAVDRAARGQEDSARSSA